MKSIEGGGRRVTSGARYDLSPGAWRATFATLALGLIVAGAGCSSTGLQAGAASYADPYLMVNDSILASQVSVVSVDYDTIGGLARGTITLRSNRDRQLPLQYRFSWYDETGRELDPGGQPYHSLLLEGQDAVTVSSVAPHPSAEEFKVRLKRVRNARSGK